MRRVCGLDVHKDSIYMCILYENGSKIESVFGVLTPELDKLRDLLVSHHVCEVALESTSIYWIPIWNILSVDFSLTSNPQLSSSASFLRLNVLSSLN